MIKRHAVARRHAVVDLRFMYLNQIRVCGLWPESVFNEFGIDGMMSSSPSIPRGQFRDSGDFDMEAHDCV